MMATQTFQSFLEEFPLYIKFKEQIPRYQRELDHRNIQLYCSQCSDTRTFRYASLTPRGATSGYSFGSAPGEQPPLDYLENNIYHIRYCCADCMVTHCHFLIHIGPNRSFVEKVGQHPKPQVNISKDLERALGNQCDVFRQGLVSEKHGYGIGAFAYYRRVLEELVGTLLDRLEELFPEGERPKYVLALENARKQHTAEDRLKLVKDFVPTHLRTEDIEPLGVLYSALSTGIHARSDEECISDATSIRVALTMLLTAIEQQKQTKKTFTDGMRKLLDKPSRR